MQRRDFLKYSVALGVASALPLWSRAVFAAERPTLPIPDLLTTDARNRIQLTIGAGAANHAGQRVVGRLHRWSATYRQTSPRRRSSHPVDNQSARQR